MAYKIICYGDSNTYGACGFVGGRHHADIRWTGILQNSGLYDVVNLGGERTGDSVGSMGTE